MGLADFGIWCAFNRQLAFTKRMLLWWNWSCNLVVSELSSEEAWRRIHRLRKGYNGLYYPESIQYKITTSKSYKFWSWLIQWLEDTCSSNNSKKWALNCIRPWNENYYTMRASFLGIVIQKMPQDKIAARGCNCVYYKILIFLCFINYFGCVEIMFIKNLNYFLRLIFL